MFNYSIPELNQGYIYTHKGCVCNENIGLHNRHLVDDGAKCVSCPSFAALRRFVKHIPPVSEQTIIDHAPSSRKKLLLGARESLKTNPINPDDYKIRMFLKDDKYNNTPDVATFLGFSDPLDHKAPRCIQYRNKRYNLRLATYLHPIEQHIYSSTNFNGTPIFAKSRNQVQRGQDLRNLWDSFCRPRAWLLDHSKFDAHCHPKLLRYEHRFYKSCNDSVELAELLAAQLLNRGRTKNGTKYVADGTRMSGDQNTGCGNSLINYGMLRSVFGPNAGYYIDGDDSVIITEDGFEPDFSLFEKYGMVTKYDSTIQFSKVEFCQCRPVTTGKHWVMVRNPYRMITRLPFTLKQFGQSKALAYMASLGQCEMALGAGLPVAQFIGQKLAALSSKRVKTESSWRLKGLVNRNPIAISPPSWEARSSYYDAWGIDVAQQLTLEAVDICTPVWDGYFEEFPLPHND